MSLKFKIIEQVKKDFQATVDFWKAASESDDIRFDKTNLNFLIIKYIVIGLMRHQLKKSKQQQKKIYDSCLSWCNENIFNN